MQQESGDAAVIRELAERLLGVRYPFGPLEAQRARLLPGALPDGLPLDLPLPAGGRLIGSAVQPQGPRPGAPPSGEGIDIVLDIPGSEAEILGFYDDTLGGLGWSVAAGPQLHQGGFQPFPMPPSRTFCQSPRGPWLSVRVLSEGSGPGDVRIHVNTATAGPCADQTGAQAGMPRPFRILPPLAAPSGVAMETLGGGGSESRVSSSGIATTTQGAVELERHFAGQFAVAGWVRQDGGVNGPLAWSTWRSTGEGDWHGLLFVVEEPEHNQRFLHARAETDSPSGRGGWGTGPGMWTSARPLR